MTDDNTDEVKQAIREIRSKLPELYSCQGNEDAEFAGSGCGTVFADLGNTSFTVYEDRNGNKRAEVCPVCGTTDARLVQVQ